MAINSTRVAISWVYTKKYSIELCNYCDDIAQRNENIHTLGCGWSFAKSKRHMREKCGARVIARPLFFCSILFHLHGALNCRQQNVTSCCCPWRQRRIILVTLHWIFTSMRIECLIENNKSNKRDDSMNCAFLLNKKKTRWSLSLSLPPTLVL